ncbi:MAG: type I restriction enzyme HsdR N-terminal domain-containing protein [Candidatus Omnitrophota bacterium]
MADIPKKVEDRLIEGLKKYQPIIVSLKDKDVNESDTVTLVTDLLADVFGFDKYTEITREHSIRGTYVDLAIILSGKIQLLIEVKAIGLELKENHVRQAVDYASNEGVEWVALTNGAIWHIYKVSFTKPITFELVLQINLSELNFRTGSHIESLFLLTKEALGKSALEDFHNKKQATSKYCISAVLLSETGLSFLRRELRRLAPNIKVDLDEIEATLTSEVIKREIFDGEELKASIRKVKKVTANKQSPKNATEKLEKPDNEEEQDVDIQESAEPKEEIIKEVQKNSNQSNP